MTRLARELAALVGREAVLDEPGALAAFAADSKIHGCVPLAVVLPDTTEQVQALMRLCAREKLPLIPRGAGTGTVGGAVPEQPALVLDLSRMNRLLAVDRDNLLADAQPGLVTAAFQAAVEKEGLFYPPDPASSATSTLGGNAATGAGGLRAVKYGVTADWIAGLEVVLADGQTIRTGTRTRKGVVGYDLTRLFVGSEGTLGVITELTLRLMPKPAAKATLLAIFDRLEQAGGAALAVLQSPVVPAAMELMDQTALSAVRLRTRDLLPPDVATLLCDVDGDPDEVAKQATLLAEVLRRVGAREVRTASDDTESLKLWSARRAISPALYDLRPHRVAEDVTVPVSRIVELITGAAQIARELELPHTSFGHAGDGNIHVNYLYDPDRPPEAAHAAAARERLFRLALSLGGTISGEHGIGIAKRPFIAWEQTPPLLDLQLRLKRAFDPLNLLNPGKMFP